MPDRRAVFLTHEPPSPPISGARIRTLHLLRQLRERGWSLGLFSLHTERDDPAASAAELGELCDDVVLVPVPGGVARYRRLAVALCRREAFQARYFFHPPAANALRHSGLLRGADAVVASLLYMYPYLPAHVRSLAVLDTHNSEVHRMASMAASAPTSLRGIVARVQARAVREYEQEAVRSVGLTLAVSAQEQRWFESISPGRTALVPNGVDRAGLAARDHVPEAPEALFVGAMGYGANQDGVRWLLEEVLPRVSRRDLKLHVVGSDPPGWLRRLAGGSVHDVGVTGFVPSTKPWFDRARLLVVPLRIGGGTRLKILESLARGVPVLSTALGCEGLELVPGRDLLVADDPVAFAAAIERLLDDDDLCRSLALHGRETVTRSYDWAHIGDTLAGALGELDRSPAGAGGAP